MIDVAEHFVRDGEDLSAVPYEYKECGLPGIFLHNGYRIEEFEGEQYVAICDTLALHQAIGTQLVCKKKELAPAEIRFLRKTMELTQSDLAGLMGQSSQQVARWEKGASAIPGPADRLLRVIFLVSTMEDNEFLDLLKDLEEMDETPLEGLDFWHEGDTWSDRKAA
ncbi:helix-turn-helix domain-containing protein [Novosphingobium album (ex Hu et al. 2023)]|uniref:HTH cro/C1-type domain-containing protein n=1 Tax=Novosphingobium album (ex Hu et al. 2023) TaxID=2930093 RepID=A0ABT0B6Y5_9SPHN|nr:helix-turn-helix domain-containing protein [Novosphingobium album (ex Hu et al. 2023)]MCJ2180806.1 hypothetical protein [Novosphingobium album (ex Hu et al. 2023)]